METTQKFLQNLSTPTLKKINKQLQEDIINCRDIRRSHDTINLICIILASRQPQNGRITHRGRRARAEKVTA